MIRLASILLLALATIAFAADGLLITPAAIPLPEPSTFLLLGMPSIGFAASARQRRKWREGTSSTCPIEPME